MSKKKRYRSIVMIAVILAVVVFVFFAARNNAGEKVVTSRSDIKCGTVITKENIAELFYIKSVSSDLLPQCFYKNASELDGMTIKSDLSANTIIQDNFVAEDVNPLYRMKNPVISGIKASDISQFAGGVIRKGDLVNISVIDGTTNECMSVLNNVYVTGAYNSDGTDIADDASCAMALNILIESEEEQKLNSMISLGELRVCMIGADSSE